MGFKDKTRYTAEEALTLIGDSAVRVMPRQRKGIKVELTDWQVEIIHRALVHFQPEAVRLGFSPLACSQLADLATKIGGDWRLPVPAVHS